MESVQRRQRMIGMMPPRQGPEVRVTDPTLLPSQRAAVGKALSAIDWCLIQGPPGTGKTSAVIRALVTQLHADETERILLLALTNRAADELANVLGQSLGPQSFVRGGGGATG
ncbi:AAA domain-containing protein, partial [Aphanothece microscopica]|uniref:AAA domain-containing protein n=1 Tax=Aphanothece microscopica TaxID=1049561 RepID=UPI0039856816